MGEGLAFVSAFCYGSAAILIRHGGEQMDRDAGLLLSVLVNAVLNIAALSLRVALGPPLAATWAGFWYFVVGGALTIFLGRSLWIRSITAIGPARAGAFKMAQVVFVLLAAVTLLGEQVSWLGLVGGAMVLVGLTSLTTERSAGLGGRVMNRAGIWYGLGSALSFAVGNLARKAGMLAWRESTAGTAIGAIVASIAALAVPGAVPRLRGALRSADGRRGAAWFLGAGVVTSVAQFSLYGALGISPIWKVNLITATEPMIVALLGLAALRGRELLSARLWAGVGLVSVGIGMIALR